jgi:hypothetical protein
MIEAMCRKSRSNEEQMNYNEEEQINYNMNKFDRRNKI